jgi:hypothetical protein
MPTLKLNEKGETGCCPRLNPEPWDGKLIEWKEKKFVKDRVRTFMFMPINFGGVMKKMMPAIEAAKAEPEVGLCLSDHTSRWNMDILVAVSKEVPGLENVTLSGKFLSKVYEGPFKDTGKWCKDFEAYAKKEGHKIKKWYMSYTTCPACAKAYGKNYVIVIGEV